MLKLEVLRGRDFVALPGFFIESYETGTNEASRSKTLQTESQCQKPIGLLARKVCVTFFSLPLLKYGFCKKSLLTLL